MGSKGNGTNARVESLDPGNVNGLFLCCEIRQPTLQIHLDGRYVVGAGNSSK